MSRLCVKNLPKHATEDRIRDFFSQKGEVTDAKLMRTKDGKSRQFGFVGYRTEQEAEEALKYFNKAYMDTSRIVCEIAHKVGDRNIPRPWSRHSVKKQEKPILEGKKDLTGGLSLATSKGLKKIKEDNENDDPLLQEFLQVMQPRAKSKLWADDSVTAPTGQNGTARNKKTLMEARGNKESSNIAAEPDKNSKSESESLDGYSNAITNGLDNNEVISDMDYFKSRVKKEWSDSESGDEENDKGVDDDDDDDGDNDDDDEDGGSKSPRKKNSKVQDKKLSLKGQQKDNIVEATEVDFENLPQEHSDHEVINSVGPSSATEEDENGVHKAGRLFVRNLPYTATEEDLEEHFGRFGVVSEVHLVVDKDSRRSKGFAYVLYKNPESAARALEELDNSIFQGRLLHIMLAKQKNPSRKQQGSASINEFSKTFKQQREDERKASEVSGNTRAWNSLFMRPDTVVENMARKFGLSKGDLLNREADDLAVRVALGETQVIAETKKALANAGVNVASLEEFANGKTDGVRRSKHVLLVKNLPYGSSEGELANMFGKFGSLDKVILPPTKTLALVVFLEPAKARAAFKGLAYKRFKDGPLYLEWAPGNVLDSSLTSVDDPSDSVVDDRQSKRTSIVKEVEGLADADIEDDRVESRSLFVKNLNFKTTEESLREHIRKNIREGRILSVRIKKHMKKGKNVSMGFGFIEFDSVDTAVNICKNLQATVLDGHALMLQLCHAKKDGQKILKETNKDQSSTKLIVRNVAFEATEKELRQLFSPFGQIKSLRLPRKIGNHRGFAFVEFVTEQETKNALQALANTHFYGRHLVLERAKEGESLEELRARTAARFSDGQIGVDSAKLSKKRKRMEAS